ncbi:MAG: pyrroline-5-carboxylate reductase [Bacillota bacterium]
MEYSSGDGASQINLALIGAGVMGEAIASALLSKGACDPRHLSVSDVRDYRLDALGQQLGVNTCSSNREAVAGASVILLAVKPQAMDTVLSDISDAIGSDQLVISVAAGIDTEWIERRLLPGARVVRAMPNTPGIIGMGITAISPGKHATEQDVSVTEGLFRCMGEVVQVDETLMDAVTGLSGSGPAYCFMFIESLAEAGVLNGLPRDVALKLACWTAMGAAALVKDSGDHPAVLKSRVTSPAGTTAAGLAVLERMGFRAAVIDAVTSAASRSKQLSSQDT